MSNDQSIFDDELTPKFDNRKRRTKRTALIIALAFIIFASLFLLIKNFVLLDEDDNITRLMRANQNSSTNDEIRPYAYQLANPHPNARGERGKLLDLIYTLIYGAEKQIEQSPHNIENIEDIVYLNYEPNVHFHHVGKPVIGKQGDPTATTKYRYSLFDLINTTIYDAQTNEKTGKIYDIIINQQNGDATAIIFNFNNTSYQRNIAYLRFSRNPLSRSKKPSLIAYDIDPQSNNFTPPQSNQRHTISLRKIYDNQVFDFEGQPLGTVIAATYSNKKAQDILFRIKPELVILGSLQTFAIPYHRVRILKHKDQSHIKLNKAQTTSFAEHILKGATK